MKIPTSKLVVNFIIGSNIKIFTKVIARSMEYEVGVIPMKVKKFGLIFVFCILIFGGLVTLMLAIHVTYVDEKEVAEFMMENISTALVRFHEDVERYPYNEEGLIALWEMPKNAKNWKGPYLKKKNILIDPWRREFFYQKIGQGYKLYSLGKDGKEGGMGEDTDVEKRVLPK